MRKPLYKKGDKVRFNKDVTTVLYDAQASLEAMEQYLNPDYVPKERKPNVLTSAKKGEEGIVTSSIVVPLGRGLPCYSLEGFEDPPYSCGFDELNLEKL